MPGTSLFAIFIVTLFAGLLLGQQAGYDNSWIIVSLAAAALSFMLFLFVEAKGKEPLIQLSLFKNPLFSISIITAFLFFTANFSFNIIAPFYAQNVLNLSPFASGFLLMMFPICMVVVAPISGALSDKIGSESLTLSGLSVMVVAQFGLSQLHEGSGAILASLWIALLGIGSGLFSSPNNSLIMSQVPRTQLGSAGSVSSLIRNVGMVFGITAATTILFQVMSREAGYRVTSLIPGRPELFLSGMHAVFLTSAFICLAAALLTGWRMVQGKNMKRSASEV